MSGLDGSEEQVGNAGDNVVYALDEEYAQRKEMAGKFIYMDYLTNPIAKAKTVNDAMRQIKRLKRKRPYGNQAEVEGVEYRVGKAGKKHPIKPKVVR